jgi:hypothetical protein
MSSFPQSRGMYNAEVSRPVEDPKRRAWIRTLPCAVCGRTRGVECAHTGDRGLSQKSSDARGIPLCKAHHDEYHQLGRRGFETKYRLDIEGLILKLNEKPRIRLYGRYYVALLGGEEYALGPLDVGLEAALRFAIQLARERPRLMRF